MSPRKLRYGLLLLLAVSLTLPAFFCSPAKPSIAEAAVHPESLWRNVYDTGAHYAGMATCATCHASVYETFIQTGMGQSFAPATRQKSAADFSPAHAQVYDAALDLHYKPYWERDSLFFLEYRLAGTDTVHKHIQRIDYIVGSGQHTNSHIYSSNGYLYQAPITFYTQQQKWDLAPGFEKGASSRFSRLIESECMTCHNGYPEFVANSQNKYVSLKSGIDCERCHGPGSLHVAEKQAGNIIDTSKGPDYSIVNPRRLSTELQNNVCQRCHLQGITVLNEGKTFFDFRPGMELSEVMNTYMPQYAGADDKMIMASHVERMKKSLCYINSGKMSCITCHNPHVSVKFTPRAQYLNACYSCHATSKNSGGLAAAATDMDAHGCTETAASRAVKNNDCVTCHMPHNGSIDIPHVAVTDHYIRRRPNPQGTGAQEKITAFLGLKCYNNDTPDSADSHTTGRAYMEFFERYGGGSSLLDSALKYLNGQTATLYDKDHIRAFYLWQNYPEVVKRGAQILPSKITDAWTAYRIGEALMQTERPQQALPFYQRSVVLWPYALDFQNKLGTCQLALQQQSEAEKTFAFILNENPLHPLANANMGFIQMQEGNNTPAYGYLTKALELNPDHEQTLINLAIWHHNNKEPEKAAMYLKRLLMRNPHNEQAKAMLQDLEESRNP